MFAFVVVVRDVAVRVLGAFVWCWIVRSWLKVWCLWWIGGEGMVMVAYV